jgi:hypothetical protein
MKEFNRRGPDIPHRARYIYISLSLSLAVCVYLFVVSKESETERGKRIETFIGYDRYD